MSSLDYPVTLRKLFITLMVLLSLLPEGKMWTVEKMPKHINKVIVLYRCTETCICV